VRPTATGEKRHTLVNDLARPRVGANVGWQIGNSI